MNPLSFTYIPLKVYCRKCNTARLVLKLFDFNNDGVVNVINKHTGNEGKAQNDALSKMNCIKSERGLRVMT